MKTAQAYNSQFTGAYEFTPATPTTAQPKKKLCAWRTGSRGLHYFEPTHPGQVFCSRRCMKNDERDRPQ